MAFVIIVGIITYNDMKKCHRLPWPPRFIFAGLTFFLMEGISLIDETVAGVMAIGMVIAIYMKDGFVASCPGEAGTASQTGQPQSVEFTGDFTGPGSGIPSVSEYQQASNPVQPGTTLA
jgi:hypothetical protein